MDAGSLPTTEGVTETKNGAGHGEAAGVQKGLRSLCMIIYSVIGGGIRAALYSVALGGI